MKSGRQNNGPELVSENQRFGVDIGESENWLVLEKTPHIRCQKQCQKEHHNGKGKLE